MSMETGLDRGSTGPTTCGAGSGDERAAGVVSLCRGRWLGWVDAAAGPSEPAADGGGCGECCWAATDTAMAIAPLVVRTAAATVATRPRRPPRIRNFFTSIRLAR